MDYSMIMTEMLRVTAGNTPCRIIDTEVDNATHTAHSTVYEGEVSALLDKYPKALSAIGGRMLVATEYDLGKAVLVIKRYHDKGEVAK